MRAIFKWVKRIFVTVISLVLVAITVLWVSFLFWNNNVFNELPKNSLLVNTAKGQVEYTLTGNSDKYMLMVHGTPGSVHVAGGQSFSDQGFSVLGISRPGYYQTPLSSGKTPKEQAALYKSLLDELKIESVWVNGISGGGPSSIQFALDYPERCDGLILSAAVSEKIGQENDEKSIVEKFFETEFGTWLGIQIALTQVDAKMKEGINWYVKRAIFPMKLNKDGYENDNYQFKDLEDFPLEQMIVPTLIFHGDKDENVPFSFGKNASKRIPNATFHPMKGKGHFVFMSTYADTIDHEIMRFINRQDK